MNQLLLHFEKLVATVRQLRSEKGCPWDKKQTTETLTRYVHEEFAEIVAALDKKDWDNLCEELGDFLYLIIMLAEIHRDEGNFSLEDVIRLIDEKLVRRHPHVFGDVRISDSLTLSEQWEKIKAAEKAEKK